MRRAAKIVRRAPSCTFRIESDDRANHWRWHLEWTDDRMPIASSDRAYPSYRACKAAVERLVAAIVQWACEETPF